MVLQSIRRAGQEAPGLRAGQLIQARSRLCGLGALRILFEDLRVRFFRLVQIVRFFEALPCPPEGLGRKFGVEKQDGYSHEVLGGRLIFTALPVYELRQRRDGVGMIRVFARARVQS